MILKHRSVVVLSLFIGAEQKQRDREVDCALVDPEMSHFLIVKVKICASHWLVLHWYFCLTFIVLLHRVFLAVLYPNHFHRAYLCVCVCMVGGGVRSALFFLLSALSLLSICCWSKPLECTIAVGFPHPSLPN